MTNPVLDQERVAFLEARRKSAPKTALLPAWPRYDKELPLVELEVTWVRFSTLNHRTKAEQLREMRKSGRFDLFSADPLGPEAQEAQYGILRSQEGFALLKEDLKERQQQEPAVVTAEGVLINGNRRSAALRSLFIDDSHAQARYVRCLVLPGDATPTELLDLETELQVARDFKEDYSWVNEALLIEELFNREGKNWDRVARKMHRDVNDVRNLYEKLQQLHQLVALSDGTRHHVDFNDNESAFDELAKHIRNKPKEEAESVRSTYYLGTLAGVNYRDLRNLRRQDAADLVRREMEADPALQPLLRTVESASQDVEGGDALDELLGGDDAPTGLTDVLSFLAKKKLDEVVRLADGQTAVVGDLFGTIRSAVTAAAREALEEKKDLEALKTPVDRVVNAIKDAERALAALPKARRFDEWDEDAFQANVASLKAVVAKLERRE
ncbi:hypothetical protein TSH58p_30020 (plasmid) [Azospirillum sp. TSH58]|uniref:hypothetical protein n=1 Tax=Azospirillum sp. TSH58 TaxID=664962 RepID=UPI000D5FF146|nr:hypothetical protein [Azospirillum sp. TSH58]AWJ87751.1 hypothetical protein TSH58p_30020 [Azospirillum sp. TSH58]PWC62120.1 hypothetical protein TSH58_25690 [Azospirillum sp. TSH58]